MFIFAFLNRNFAYAFNFKNRSLVTKTRFAKGETLFTEKPIVSAQFAWNQFYNYRVRNQKFYIFLDDLGN